jgi:hypothetical protein
MNASPSALDLPSASTDDASAGAGSGAPTDARSVARPREVSLQTAGPSPRVLSMPRRMPEDAARAIDVPEALLEMARRKRNATAGAASNRESANTSRSAPRPESGAEGPLHSLVVTRADGASLMAPAESALAASDAAPAAPRHAAQRWLLIGVAACLFAYAAARSILGV